MSAPFMQLYVADYLGDTRHLTTEQHGAYLLILMAMWRSGGTLSNDPVKLSRVCGLTCARWKKISDDVMAFFQPCEGGITQGRLSAELAIAEEKSQKRSQAGRAGGRAKALKDHKTGLANAKRLSWHSPEPDTIKKEETNVSCPSAAPKRSNSSSDFDAFWEAYPSKVGKKAAVRAWQKAKDRPDIEDVLSALARYRASKPVDREWCHPTTWINQGRWDDQAEEKSGASVVSIRPSIQDPELRARYEALTGGSR